MSKTGFESMILAKLKEACIISSKNSWVALCLLGLWLQQKFKQFEIGYS